MAPWDAGGQEGHSKSGLPLEGRSSWLLRDKASYCLVPESGTTAQPAVKATPHSSSWWEESGVLLTMATAQTAGHFACHMEATECQRGFTAPDQIIRQLALLTDRAHPVRICASPGRHLFKTVLSSAFYYNFFFFWRAFHLSKRMPGTFLSWASMALFHLVELDGKQGKSRSVSGPLRILQRALWRWLASLFTRQAPTWRLEGGKILGTWSCWRTEKTRRGSTRTQDVYISGSQGKSWGESQAREASCLKKYTWNLNGVLFRGQKEFGTCLFTIENKILADDTDCRPTSHFICS